MSVHEIIAELPNLSDAERELILRKLVNLDQTFEPTPAMEEAIREGLRSIREEKTYSAAEIRARIAAWATGRIRPAGFSRRREQYGFGTL